MALSSFRFTMLLLVTPGILGTRYEEDPSPPAYQLLEQLQQQGPFSQPSRRLSYRELMAHQGFPEPQLPPEFSQHTPQSVLQQQDSALMQQDSAPMQEVAHLMQSMESLQKKSTGLEMQLSEARDMAYAAASRSTAADQNARKLAQVALATMSQAKRSIDHEQKLVIQAKKSVDHEQELEREKQELQKAQQELQAELSFSKAEVNSLKMVQTDLQRKTAKAQKENMEMSARLSHAKESLSAWQQDLSVAQMNGGEGIRERQEVADQMEQTMRPRETEERQEVAAQMEQTMRPLETEERSLGEKDAAYRRLPPSFDDVQQAFPSSLAQASDNQEASFAIHSGEASGGSREEMLRQLQDELLAERSRPASPQGRSRSRSGSNSRGDQAATEVPSYSTPLLQAGTIVEANTAHQKVNLLEHLRSRSADLARHMMDPWSSDGQ